MKTITITYDDSKPVPTLNVSAQGFTNAEILVILDESKQKVKDAVIDELKKKSTGIITPHLMRPPIA